MLRPLDCQASPTCLLLAPGIPGKGAIVTFVLQNTFDFPVYVCICAHVCLMCTVRMEAEESVGSPGVTGSQEPLDMGAGN